MNILICSEFFFPSIGGSQKVVEELAKNFIDSNHKVTIATTYIHNRKKLNDIDLIEFKISGNFVRGFNGEIGLYKKFLLNNKFDVVFFYAAQQWTFDLALKLLGRIKSKIIFCPCGYSALNNTKYNEYFKILSKKLPLFNACVYHGYSYQDYYFAQRYSLKNAHVIENGASDEFLVLKKNLFKKKYKINGFMVLNVSNYSFMKGQDYSILLFMMSKLKGTMVFIGNNNLRFSSIYFVFIYLLKIIVNIFCKSKKIIFLNSIDRKDVVNAFVDSDIFLFTSRIECSPIVLFESCASMTPFISNDVGNAKEISKWTNSGLVSKSFKQLLDYLNMFYKDDKKRLSLSKNGRLAYTNRFNWKYISLKYIRLMS